MKSGRFIMGHLQRDGWLIVDGLTLQRDRPVPFSQTSQGQAVLSDQIVLSQHIFIRHYEKQQGEFGARHGEVELVFPYRVESVVFHYGSAGLGLVVFDSSHVQFDVRIDDLKIDQWI